MQYRGASYASGVWDVYYFERNIFGDIVAVYGQNGTKLVSYSYDAWGRQTVTYTNNGASTTAANNPFRYRGYYFDADLNLYYLNARYYDQNTGRFISPDSLGYLGANGDLNSFNLYAYCGNNTVNCKQISTSLGTSITLSSISKVDSVNMGGVGATSSGRITSLGWLQSVVGGFSDIVLGLRYLVAGGMHNKFAYATNTRYMHPIMGGNWRWFAKSGSLTTDFVNVAQGTFRQILTGDAKAGLGAILKSAVGVVGVNALINFGFNFYENNWKVDSAMLKDTAIDTAIGVSSYYLAVGTTSLLVSGLVTIGISVPGVAVVACVVLLSMGFEYLIRESTDYQE